MVALSRRMWRWVDSKCPPSTEDPPSLLVLLVATVATGLFQIEKKLGRKK